MANLEADPALFNEYHGLIVCHGKEVCRREPRCEECPLLDGCPTGREKVEGVASRSAGPRQAISGYSK